MPHLSAWTKHNASTNKIDYCLWTNTICLKQTYIYSWIVQVSYSLCPFLEPKLALLVRLKVLSSKGGREGEREENFLTRFCSLGYKLEPAFGATKDSLRDLEPVKKQPLKLTTIKVIYNGSGSWTKVPLVLLPMTID